MRSATGNDAVTAARLAEGLARAAPTRRRSVPCAAGSPRRLRRSSPKSRTHGNASPRPTASGRAGDRRRVAGVARAVSRAGWLRGRARADDLAVLLAAARSRRSGASASTTPDGDFWDFDWLDAAGAADAPLVVLFHGLEGSSRLALRARADGRARRQRGWRGVIPHFRGCSGEPNRHAARVPLRRS